jgi:hypothetical protein
MLTHVWNLRSGATVCHLFGMVTACVFSLCLTPACQTSCSSGNQEPIRFSDGITRADLGTYESTPYDGEWLHYPSNRRFEFPHNLGTADYEIQAFVAFSSHPVATDGLGASDIAVAAGDIMVIERKTNDTLLVRNDTCSAEYLYVKLFARLPEIDAGVDSQ